MDDKDFETLKVLIRRKTEELDALQKKYIHETGVSYALFESMSGHEVDADITRKNKLLKVALKQLLALEWEVPLSVITAIKKELVLI